MSGKRTIEQHVAGLARAVDDYVTAVRLGSDDVDVCKLALHGGVEAYYKAEQLGDEKTLSAIDQLDKIDKTISELGFWREHDGGIGGETCELLRRVAVELKDLRALREVDKAQIASLVRAQVTQGKFQIVDGQIVGPGLKIEAAVFVEPERQADPAEGKKIILDAIIEVANGAYREGRASVLESFDDWALLRDAASALHSLGQLLGPTAGDRHRRAADVVARLIKQHEEEGGR